MKEEMGQDLPHKTFIEDAFVRKFMHGTWPELLLSEVVHRERPTQNCLKKNCYLLAFERLHFMRSLDNEFNLEWHTHGDRSLEISENPALISMLLPLLTC